jgi:hypothetical protein
MWKRTFILIAVTFLCVSALIIQSALGLEYPTRPIELSFVSQTPGSSFGSLFRRRLCLENSESLQRRSFRRKKRKEE